MMAKFSTAINCIDGRTHEPLIAFMKEKFGIDFVDLITIPGADGVFSRGSSKDEDQIENSRRSISISIDKHHSELIAIAGHFDCAGNPGDRQYHIENIKKAKDVISSMNFDVKVIGLYINENWAVEQIE